MEETRDPCCKYCGRAAAGDLYFEKPLGGPELRREKRAEGMAVPVCAGLLGFWDALDQSEKAAGRRAVNSVAVVAEMEKLCGYKIRVVPLSSGEAQK